jgi:hypothetical protein
MVIPFRKGAESSSSAKAPERQLVPVRRPLTPREITHRERMLSHLSRLAALRPDRQA